MCCWRQDVLASLLSPALCRHTRTYTHTRIFNGRRSSHTGVQQHASLLLACTRADVAHTSPVHHPFTNNKHESHAFSTFLVYVSYITCRQQAEHRVSAFTNSSGSSSRPGSAGLQPDSRPWAVASMTFSSAAEEVSKGWQAQHRCMVTCGGSCQCLVGGISSACACYTHMKQAHTRVCLFVG